MLAHNHDCEPYSAKTKDYGKRDSRYETQYQHRLHERADFVTRFNICHELLPIETIVVCTFETPIIHGQSPQIPDIPLPGCHIIVWQLGQVCLHSILLIELLLADVT